MSAPAPPRPAAAARRAFLAAGALCAALSAAPARAQQFQHQVGALPGTPRWSEGVECADVDGDGDLDVLFAEGEGFSGAGTQRQNVLLINKLVETSTLSFVDESVARLGTHLSNAKGVITGDVTGDGWVDLLFVNAFLTDPPFLYVNQGASNPGFFTEEGAARGVGAVVNAAGAQFGDVDDDGDLDLVICDSGANFFGNPGGAPRLYLNDGTGNFTKAVPPQWNPPLKKAQMDVQLADLDGDFDIDFFGACRASNSGGNHYLMENDGTGAFTDVSSSLPSSSSNVYEVEVGDLDGDTDLDFFFVSLNSFSEGAMRNDSFPSGTLGFTALAPLSGFNDDNEIVLLDYDNDGDLDSFVGSLGSREGLWRNDGGLSFTNREVDVEAVSDPTLDMTAADVDNDGDYDLITSQGEGAPAAWANKLFLNTGAPDTLPPVIVATKDVPQLDTTSGPWVAHAKMRDQMIDDGKTWVTGTAHFVVTPTPLTGAVSIDPGGFTPSNLVVAAGTVVTFTNASGANRTVTCTTAPWTWDSGTLANAATFEHAFVRPGVYAYTSTLGGGGGTVTVTGSSSAAPATHSGGGLFRFAMTGDASAPAARLVYELAFVDWPGNESVTDGHVTEKAPTVGTPVCFGDGSGTACPCGNTGGAGEGCANSTGVGALLSASGSDLVVQDDLVLHAAQARPNKNGMFLQGATAIANPFRDGILCTGNPTERLELITLDAVGAGDSTVSIVTEGNVSAGQTRWYQFWFRDGMGPCGNGSNLSGALQVDWQ